MSGTSDKHEKALDLTEEALDAAGLPVRPPAAMAA